MKTPPHRSPLSARPGAVRRSAIAVGVAIAATLPGPAAAAAPAPDAVTPLAGTASHVEVEGVPFEDSTTVAGTRLVLNGVSVRKRAFFKTEVIGLYLPQRTTSADAVLRGSATSPRRLRVVMLRDAPALLAARLFATDFKRFATEAEYQSLREDVNAVTALYESLPGLKAGDELVVDWVPGQGVSSRLNGRPFGKTLNSELFFQIACLRPGLSADAPAEQRAQLLGQVRLPTAPGPYPPARPADVGR